MAWDRELIKNREYRSRPGKFDALVFARQIEKQYLEGTNKTGFKTKKSFSPSGVGYGSGTCPRYWFYAFTGAEFEDSSDALGMANMENGVYVHERLQKKIGELGYDKVEFEKKVESEDPPIFGFADVVIEHNGNKIVGEIKSMKDEQFGPRAFKMTAPGYHQLQLVIYLRVLGIDEGFFLYENKNTNQLLVIPIVMNEENEALADAALEWMRAVYENWQKGTLPERPFTKSTLPCRTCPVSKVCWEGEKGEVKLLPLVVPA